MEKNLNIAVLALELFFSKEKYKLEEFKLYGKKLLLKLSPGGKNMMKLTLKCPKKVLKITDKIS